VSELIELGRDRFAFGSLGIRLCCALARFASCFAGEIGWEFHKRLQCSGAADSGGLFVDVNETGGNSGARFLSLTHAALRALTGLKNGDVRGTQGPYWLL